VSRPHANSVNIFLAHPENPTAVLPLVC